MFGLGAKSNVPQSSQYDFKGTTVHFPIISDQTPTKFIQTHSLPRRQCRHIRRRWQATIQSRYRLLEQVVVKGQSTRRHQVQRRTVKKELSHSVIKLQKTWKVNQHFHRGMCRAQARRYFLCNPGNYMDALEKAKEATNKEKNLRKLK